MGGRAVAKDIRKAALKKKKEEDALAQENSPQKAEKLAPNPGMNVSPPSEGGEPLTENENSVLGSQSEKNVALLPTGSMPEAELPIAANVIPEKSLNDTTPKKQLKRFVPDPSHQSTPTQSSNLETFDKKLKTLITTRQPVGSPRKRRKIKISFTK